MVPAAVSGNRYSVVSPTVARNSDSARASLIGHGASLSNALMSYTPERPRARLAPAYTYRPAGPSAHLFSTARSAARNRASGCRTV